MVRSSTRRLALVAVLAAIVVLVRVWPAPHGETSSHAAPDRHPDAAGRLPAASDAAPREVVAGAGTSMPVPRPTPGVKEASRAIGAPVRLEVLAPSDVRVGDVFQARVDVGASIALRDLMFSIAYENSRLSLVGRSEGAFLRQPGVAAEFGVDEPSDGNIEVVFRAGRGSAATGSGSVVVLEFEALGSGASGIELRNVKSVDVGGANANVAVRQGRVTIH